MNLKNKKVLVYDFGLFVSLAQRLSRDFGEVLYFCPWQTGYPKADNAFIGKGLPGIKRVDDFWKHVDEVDLIACLDVGTGELQEYLQKHGYRVFGAGLGEKLEQDRIYFRELLERSGLHSPKYEVVKGLENLRKYLKGKEDKWVKLSTYRGITETFHWKNWLHSRSILDTIAPNAGEFQNKIDFIVEENIPGVEFASDWFVSDGIHLPSGIWGYEEKDIGYCGKAADFVDLPKELREVDEALEPEMEKFGVNGFVAIEIRMDKDKKPYAIDPCMRPGSPTSEILGEMYANFSEIVWAVSNGDVVVPEATKKYGASVLLKSDFAKTSWTAVDFPKEKADQYKWRNLCKLDGQYYYIPKDNGYIIGAAIGMGDSLEEAQSEALEAAEEAEGEGLYYDSACFDKIDETLEKAEEIGLGHF